MPSPAIACAAAQVPAVRGGGRSGEPLARGLRVAASQRERGHRPGQPGDERLAFDALDQPQHRLDRRLAAVDVAGARVHQREHGPGHPDAQQVADRFGDPDGLLGEGQRPWHVAGGERAGRLVAQRRGRHPRWRRSSVGSTSV
ncbi:MAG: hypothetical protein L0H64_17895 [Pseudonocardia sp.]|nr:hypothetical protein [Pseudonocardia sp.]